MKSALIVQREDVMNWVHELQERVNHEWSEQRVQFSQSSIVTSQRFRERVLLRDMRTWFTVWTSEKHDGYGSDQ
jgi:hypothetical protein